VKLVSEADVVSKGAFYGPTALSPLTSASVACGWNMNMYQNSNFADGNIQHDMSNERTFKSMPMGYFLEILCQS
jgi:hypothetical protein